MAHTGDRMHWIRELIMTGQCAPGLDAVGGGIRKMRYRTPDTGR